MLGGVVDFVLIALGFACLAVGFLGCLLPILPGPPIACLALLCLGPATDWAAPGRVELLALGGVAAAVTALDFVIPVLGAKRYGASRMGIWFAMLGMVIGFFFPVLPPFNVIVGTFVGAFVGESMAGKQDKEALRAAWGTFVGTLFGVFLKLAACGAIAWYFVKGVF